MPVNYKEMAFEAAIEAHLVEHGCYEKGNPDDFDRTRCLFPKVLIEFIQNAQPKTWDTIVAYHGKNTEAQLLDDLTKALASLGMLHVLRHGFNCFGKLVRVAYFAPASGLNPETAALYAKNRLTVTRQAHFSDKDEKSLDLVLAINGLPVATAELKNPLTKQNVFHAMRQYREDRDPREPMFRFKERALVHFAVDPDLVYMTTKLEAKSTHFLPFNRGNNQGAGNPPNPEGYRTAYLWEEVWVRDSLLDIVGRFLHLETEEKDVLITRGGKSEVKKLRKESMIFPRYHQLDAVRRLVTISRVQGAGHN